MPFRTYDLSAGAEFTISLPVDALQIQRLMEIVRFRLLKHLIADAPFRLLLHQWKRSRMQGPMNELKDSEFPLKSDISIQFSDFIDLRSALTG
jgi:hypothetical protein